MLTDILRGLLFNIYFLICLLMVRNTILLNRSEEVARQEHEEAKRLLEALREFIEATKDEEV